MSIWKALGFSASPYDACPLRPTPEGADLFVGRSRELIEFCTVLEASVNGVFIISGQPGVGKTSFLNVAQYLMENHQSPCGPHLLCARSLCPIQPTDGPKEVAQRALASLVRSVEEYCAISTQSIPPETKKISKWINDRGSSDISLGINILNFGANFGRSVDLPRMVDASYERLMDVIVCVISEVVTLLGFSGAFIVLDNIENLEEGRIAQLMMTFRDTLFVTPHTWWVVIGQSGLGSLIQTLEPRVFERISGVGLELRPIALEELHNAIGKRVSKFHKSGSGKAPLSVSGRLKPATEERFKTSHFEKGVRPVEYPLTEGGTTDGEPDQSDCNSFDRHTLQPWMVQETHRTGARA